MPSEIAIFQIIIGRIAGGGKAYTPEERPILAEEHRTPPPPPLRPKRRSEGEDEVEQTDHRRSPQVDDPTDDVRLKEPVQKPLEPGCVVR